VRYIVLFIAFPIMAVGLVEFLLLICGAVRDTIIGWKRHREYLRVRRDFLDSPVEMVNDRGEVFWVGYKK